MKAVYFQRKFFHFFIISTVILCSHPNLRVKLQGFLWEKLKTIFENALLLGDTDFIIICNFNWSPQISKFSCRNFDTSRANVFIFESFINPKYYQTCCQHDWLKNKLIQIVSFIRLRILLPFTKKCIWQEKGIQRKRKSEKKKKWKRKEIGIWKAKEICKKVKKRNRKKK